MIHNRFHMRFEIDNFTQFPLMMEYLKGYVHLLSFMDHTLDRDSIEIWKYIRKPILLMIREHEVKKKLKKC